MAHDTLTMYTCMHMFWQDRVPVGREGWGVSQAAPQCRATQWHEGICHTPQWVWLYVGVCQHGIGNGYLIVCA